MKTMKKGFTIVELLIVIVVIAILAAVVIVSYNGVMNNARTATMKTNMEAIASSLKTAALNDGGYPQNIEGLGTQTNDGDIYEYTSTGDSYCLMVTRNSITYTISSSNNSVEEGVCAEPYVNSGSVGTLAGSGVAGFAEGSGVSAQFNLPRGVAVDNAGTIYVADTYNNRIRKITPAGVVSTLAGSSTRGFAEGSGANAKFQYPQGIAVDGSGTVYVADTYNHSIRLITPAGVVSTLAGSGVGGFAEGSGANAKFQYPQGVAVDSAGVVYVADMYNNRIRKITTDGTVSTFAGSGRGGYTEGSAEIAQFNQPYNVTVDSGGVVYVADMRNQRIRMITPEGEVSTFAGSGSAGFTNGSGEGAQFNNPYGVVVDSSGLVYVADESNNRIRLIQ